MKHKLITVLMVVGLLSTSALGYGPQGHRMVGAIADQHLLKTNPATETKIRACIEGLSLADAALIPDEIKDWDKPGAQRTLPQLNSNSNLLAQLVAFWKANNTPPAPGEEVLHRLFHFTDVPILDPENYADGQTGRSQFDIVHMISYCVGVLRGDIPESNERGITKPVAIILLAHYLGDIHQPLHVGAEYFAANGQPDNPDKGVQGFNDEGGNTLNFILHGANGHPQPAGELHGYWDTQTVKIAVGQTGEAQLVQMFASSTPTNWQAPQGDAKDWAEAWANEILPIARQAHQRLIFKHIHIASIHGTKKATGNAEERPMPDGISYQVWAGNTVKEELHLAGWRLAALMTQVIQ